MKLSVRPIIGTRPVMTYAQILEITTGIATKALHPREDWVTIEQFITIVG